MEISFICYKPEIIPNYLKDVSKAVARGMGVPQVHVHPPFQKKKKNLHLGKKNKT